MAESACKFNGKEAECFLRETQIGEEAMSLSIIELVDFASRVCEGKLGRFPRVDIFATEVAQEGRASPAACPQNRG